MAPPVGMVQEEHKPSHHRLHVHEVQEEEKAPCRNTKCSYRLPTDAKFCMMCGAKRPEEKRVEPCQSVETGGEGMKVYGFRRTVWLFFHAEEREARARGKCKERSTGDCLLRLSDRFELFSILLVLYLVFMDIIMSIEMVKSVFSHTIIVMAVEAGIYAIFTLEYSSRVWSCMESPVYAELGWFRGRLKLMSGVIEMVDLVVLLAYYINFMPGFNRLKGLSALRMIRLLRVAALLKVERKTSSFSKIVSVLKTKKSELIATLFTAAVLMIMSATTMYYIENEAQPVAFGSVPAAMWWSVTALTTVGYGDVVPKTPAGKVLGSIVAFFGVGLFALPAGILGSGFVEEVDKAKRSAQEALEEDAEEDGNDEGQELLADEERQAQMIEQLTEDVKTLQGTVDSLRGGQSQILDLIRTMCPSLEVHSSVKLDAFRPISDNELVALQENVAAKLDKLTRRSLR